MSVELRQLLQAAREQESSDEQLAILHQARRLIESECLFSNNEALDEITTSSLEYLSIDALEATAHSSVADPSRRRKHLLHAQVS